ncbi:28 kDa heat- and acid-stable phosphoprotein [Senna tora]|uniref:28 kDa heat- and acid-stable phosphoprotein n=1 Tax=Senna tora TaxID=362788 RepID=A0A834WB50_9FABA|nr:28 kDa heat- and acid-stable phosphoprotein [Senna tora]
MARGNFKSKPTGRRQFSTREEVEREEEESEEECGENSEDSEEEEEETRKTKGTQGVIEIENPNLVKPKSLRARDVVEIGKTSELSRREREEIEKQRGHMQGKTEQARKDLERLALVRQERAEAAKRREEEKAAKEQRKLKKKLPRNHKLEESLHAVRDCDERRVASGTFVVCAWRLWWRRNKVVFEGVKEDKGQVFWDVLFRAKEISESWEKVEGVSRKRMERKKEILVGWKPPDMDWYKVNVDASVNKDNSAAVCGGLLRDSSGSWIKGFTFNIGDCSVIEAELWVF